MTNETRTAHREALKTILESQLKKRGKGEWTTLFIDAGLPAGPIHSLDEVFNDAQVRHCNLAEEVEHPVLGTRRQVVTPLSNSTFAGQSSSRLTRLPPPDLGEHTVELLHEANFDLNFIQSLRDAGIVHQAERTAERAAAKHEMGTI
jgi:formyl-CoA transferase